VGVVIRPSILDMKSFAIKLAPGESCAFARIEGGRFALNVRGQSPRTRIGGVGRRPAYRAATGAVAAAAA
jgi:hypothetical protein